MEHRRPRPWTAALAAALLACELTAPRAAAQPAPPAPAPVPAAPVPVLVVPPRALTPLHADYPEGARGDADVVLVIVVDTDGSVRSARVATGDEPFASAAAAASTGWRFEPATREGKPIAVSIKAQVRFVAPPPPDAVPVAPSPSPSGPPAPGAPAAPSPPERALEVTVHGQVPSPGVQSFSRAEVRLLPGAFGDPFRAIDALPGVTPLASGLPFFYVRGAPPGNVGYFLDGIRVPLLYHIGLGPSVVHPAIMERVDLYSGGYPARFGRYAGGIVSGETRDPDPAWHGEANIRLVDAGAMVQGPLPGDRGSFFAAGRYSYTGLLLSVISSNVNLGYWDYQTRVTFHATARDDVTVFAFGAHDYLGNKDKSGTHTLFDTTFHRVDVRYDHRFGGPDDRVRQAITLGYDQTSFDKGGFVNDWSLSARTEVTKRATENVLLRAGLDASVDVYGGNLFPSFGPDPGGAPLTAGSFALLFHDHTDLAVGVRADAVIALTPRFEITPGVRVDSFGSQGPPTFGSQGSPTPLGGTRGLAQLGTRGPTQTAFAVDPRLAARLLVTKEVRLITAHGLASQAPSFILPGPGFTRDLTGGLQRSFQSSLGVEADLPWDVSATVTVFRNAFFNMTDALGTASIPAGRDGFTDTLNARTDGSSIGLEVMLRRRLTRRLGGLVSYTLSRSERILGRGSVLSSFDRTHVLNVAGTYDLGRGYKAGTRMVLYSGFPIDNLRDLGRVPPFFRFDARVEKRWRIASGRGWISLVLEAQNALGAKETLQETPVTGGYKAVQIGPVTIPSIGLEGGF